MNRDRVFENILYFNAILGRYSEVQAKKRLTGIEKYYSIKNIHKEKQSGYPLFGANRYTHIYIYISYICVYILFICLRL